MMIQLKGLHKTYKGAQPLHVLKGIDLEIEEGEFVAIMGASGSGKSTLLNILGILDDYDDGEYTLNGTLIKDLSETKAAGYRNRMIGFVFQSFNLIPYKDALENVALPLFYQGVSRRKRNAIAMEYLDKVGLRDWASHLPGEMSGGQKQRKKVGFHIYAERDLILSPVRKQYEIAFDFLSRHKAVSVKTVGDLILHAGELRGDAFHAIIV